MVNNKLRGKRKKCVELLTEMASAMSFPKESIQILQEMDLTVVSNEHIDLLYAKLVIMFTECNPKLMAEWLRKSQEMQN